VDETALAASGYAIKLFDSVEAGRTDTGLPLVRHIEEGSKMPAAFREIFDRAGDTKNQRSKFLSRLFRIFSERLVTIWANDERAPFENLGRPTLRWLCCTKPLMSEVPLSPDGFIPRFL
jgi:hypothetical protein